MQPACKPGSVFRIRGMSVIYLVLPSPTSFSGLPLGIGRAILKYRYTWRSITKDESFNNLWK